MAWFRMVSPFLARYGWYEASGRRFEGIPAELRRGDGRLRLHAGGGADFEEGIVEGGEGSGVMAEARKEFEELGVVCEGEVAGVPATTGDGDADDAVLCDEGGAAAAGGEGDVEAEALPAAIDFTGSAAEGPAIGCEASAA